MEKKKVSFEIFWSATDSRTQHPWRNEGQLDGKCSARHSVSSPSSYDGYRRYGYAWVFFLSPLLLLLLRLLSHVLLRLLLLLWSISPLRLV